MGLPMLPVPMNPILLIARDIRWFLWGGGVLRRAALVKLRAGGMLGAAWSGA